MSHPPGDPTLPLQPPQPPPDLPEQVYRQLKAIAHARMAGEREGHLLQTTALVHEALMKMTRDGQIRLEDRPEFFRAAAAAMRQILIDHARAAARLKRGGDGAGGGGSGAGDGAGGLDLAEGVGASKPRRVRVEVTELQATLTADPDQVLAVDEAMGRLAANDPAAAELVRLRFFAGLTMEEAASAAGVPLRTAERLWTYARAWLWRELSSDDA